MLRKLLILFLIPFMLCACTKSNVEEVTFSSWGSITETKILEHVISDFERENPEIRVNFMHIPQNYFQKIHLLFASNQAPDVIFVNNLYLPVYASKLEEIKTLDKSDFYTQSLEALSYEGKLYAVPRDISNLVFYYNKNLVKGNPDKDWTMDEFYKLVQKSTTTDVFGVSYERDIFWAMPYVLTLGSIDKGVDFYKKLEGKYAPTPAAVGSQTLAQMFLDGKIAFYLSGRWMYPKIEESAKFPWSVVNFPGKVPADASGWAVSKDSKHKEAAFKLVDYLSSKESIEYFAKTGLIVPARKDCEIKGGEAFLEAIQRSEVVSVGKDYKKRADKLNKELFN